jgi:hypothetical protein
MDAIRIRTVSVIRDALKSFDTHHGLLKSALKLPDKGRYGKG